MGCFIWGQGGLAPQVGLEPTALRLTEQMTPIAAMSPNYRRCSLQGFLQKSPHSVFAWCLPALGTLYRSVRQHVECNGTRRQNDAHPKSYENYAIKKRFPVEQRQR